MPLNIEGNSVRLRAVEPEDLETLYEIENNLDLWNVGVTNMPYSRYALHEYLVNVTGDIYTDKQLRLMMETPEGETVGIADLANFDPRHNRAEVGIVVKSQFCGQGYGHAAMTWLIRYAREVIHLHQMYAFISEDNASCQHLFEEVGFQKVAQLSDWLYDGKAYHHVVLLQYFL